MDSGRRAQILDAYTRHARRFDKIAAQPFHTTGLFQGSVLKTGPTPSTLPTNVGSMITAPPLRARGGRRAPVRA
jgi:hypothetical protein